MSDIERKVAFILEMEKLKSVLRKTKPVGEERFENSAEHSWQTTLAAVLFMPEELDAAKVLKMLLIHDIVEIDTGDVFVYDDAAREAAYENERVAAQRIFGMLPDPLSDEMLHLWEEFEARSSPEAVYAKAVDRLCPVVQNTSTNPNSWTEHGISKEQVLAKNEEIENVNPALWSILQDRIDEHKFG